MRFYLLLWPVLLASLEIASGVSGPFNITYDDTNSAIQYSASPGWNTDLWALQSPPPYNGTNHGSPNTGAQMTFTFIGDAIFIYGYKGADHGSSNFLIDDTQAVQCNGGTGQQGSQALLFYRTNLSTAEHTLVVKNTGTQGQDLNIDYLVVTQGGNQTTDTQLSNPKKRFPIAIVAGAAGGAILLILISWLAFRFIRRHRRHTYLAREADIALRSSTSSPPPGTLYSDNKPSFNSGRSRLTSMDHAVMTGSSISRPDEPSMQPLLDGNVGYSHRSQPSIDHTPTTPSSPQRLLQNDHADWYPDPAQAVASTVRVRRVSPTVNTSPRRFSLEPAATSHSSVDPPIGLTGHMHKRPSHILLASSLQTFSPPLTSDMPETQQETLGQDSLSGLSREQRQAISLLPPVYTPN